MTKQQAEKKHARRRFWLRYGIRLTNSVRRAILREIHEGRADVVEHQSLRVSVLDVVVEGQTVRVVYDRNRQEIVTALPRPEDKP